MHFDLGWRRAEIVLNNAPARTRCAALVPLTRARYPSPADDHLSWPYQLIAPPWSNKKTSLTPESAAARAEFCSVMKNDRQFAFDAKNGRKNLVGGRKRFDTKI